MFDDTESLERVGLGAAAGLVGTMALQTTLKANQKWLPSAMPPMREEPGKFMVRSAERALPRQAREAIPEPVENAAGQLLGLGYGVTFGMLYAALRPRGGSPLADGLALGLATWAAGYLGWLPATGLMPPVWRQKPMEAAAPVVEHVLYGMATVAVYDWLEERIA